MFVVIPSKGGNIESFTPLRQRVWETRKVHAERPEQKSLKIYINVEKKVLRTKGEKRVKRRAMEANVDLSRGVNVWV